MAAVASIFDLILALIRSIILGVFMSNLDEKMVKFTSVESYRTYNVFLSYFQEKSSSFDKIKDFRSNFKKEKRFDKA